MIHREGYASIAVALLFASAISVIAYQLLTDTVLQYALYSLGAIVLVLVLQFFRNPKRHISPTENTIICPADGKVVIIDEVEEHEYFKGKRLLVSIFMSPINVHVNRNPVNGTVKYFKYHPGAYLVAWHPKSSTENERTTVVATTQNGTEILYRQVAGALARRIVWYIKTGDQLTQGQEYGFIKFGSRVDLYLPLGTQVQVQLNQKVRGGETLLASL